jgi:alginate O-acetyltransferase complex protein AlgI
MFTSAWSWLALALLAVLLRIAPRQLRHPAIATLSAASLATVAPGAVALALGGTHAVYGLYHPAVRGRLTTPLVALALLVELAAFKYLPPLAGVEGVAVPLGLSYATFKLLHYAIERHRGKLADAGLARFLSWMLLFPIFTAGPIERLDRYLSAEEPGGEDLLVVGATRIAHGLVKKFLLADLLVAEVLAGPGPQEVVEGLDTLPVLALWRFLLLTFAYNYLDFSAYSDLAIGASRLLGCGSPRTSTGRSPPAIWRTSGGVGT